MKRLRLLLIPLFALLSPGVMAAPDASPTEANVSGYQGKAFDFTALQSLIRDRSVTTLDELISVLPDNYKKHFILMNQSGSLQSASPESPRVVSYGNYQLSNFMEPDSNLDRLYLGFQTDTSSTSKLPNSLEVIEWSPAQKSYLFYQVDFPITPKSITQNPASCTQCHGTPLRPNWTAYPRWDGAIGNGNALDGAFNHLRAVTPKNEAQNLFNTLADKNPRLRALDFSQYLVNNLEDPNAHLSDKIHQQMVGRNLDLIQKRADYEKLKYALAGAIIGCVNVPDFFQPSVFASLQNGVFASLKNAPTTRMSAVVSTSTDLNYKNTFDLTGALYQKSTRFLDFRDSVALTTWLRYLYEGEGNPEVLKNLIGSPPMDPTNANWNYDFVSFGAGWSSLQTLYLKNSKNDPELADFNLYDAYLAEAEWKQTQFGNGDQMGDPDVLENGPAKPVCQALAQKSTLAATLSPPPLPVLPPAVIPASNHALENFTHYCMECHDPDDGNPLPLDDLGALKSYRSSRGESIAERLSRNEMPPPGAPQPSAELRKTMADAVR